LLFETWPPIDVCEAEGNCIILCEIAGMKEEDFAVTVEGDRLTISGERSAWSFRGKVVCHRMEIHSGPFSREFFIPSQIDSEKIEATYKNGFLRIEMPKIEPAKEISADS
jgi:HSP20 family protein